jgi:hypothetical protein
VINRDVAYYGAVFQYAKTRDAPHPWFCVHLPKAKITCNISNFFCGGAG